MLQRSRRPRWREKLLLLLAGAFLGLEILFGFSWDGELEFEASDGGLAHDVVGHLF